MDRSVFTSIAFWGTKPKLLRNDRTIPRTATKDEVTSTAQMAIWPASSRSRKVRRRGDPANPVA